MFCDKTDTDNDGVATAVGDKSCHGFFAESVIKNKR